MPGNGYRGNGDEFVRINLACPKELVIDGMQRLKQGVEELSEKWLVRRMT